MRVNEYTYVTESGVHLTVFQHCKQVRAACQEEPADVTVVKTALLVNGQWANPAKYAALVDRVIERGRLV